MADITKTWEDSNSRIVEGRESHDFGVSDTTKAKRPIGCVVSFQVKVFVEMTKEQTTGSHSYMTIEPGTYFCWWNSSTRGGEIFGAGQSWHYCKTEQERFEQVEKYLQAAKARALKKFGPRA